MEGKPSQKEVGAWGEEKALSFLRSKGMVLIKRNFKVPVGEVDLIMDDSGTLVFVEVKTRRSQKFGTPEESITQAKLDRIYKASIEFIDQNNYHDRDWRMDVIAIESTYDMKIESIHHYPYIEYRPT